ncbi:MAG: FKBP-type peptidyl-prolyl cis-trans isomerase [Bacteroidaceae bacterium]|nr:FKBP-type peptidyl-prolyl cis-trans isomerase [Bacteroidaceae bacterium]
MLQAVILTFRKQYPIQEAEMSKREYVQANREWLEAKSKEEGVKALSRGIYYKVLKEGNQSSEQPNIRSIITAHYIGKTINGKKFDSSRGRAPLACRLCDLINGWIIALQQMHIGDKWELYIPAEMGYGRFSQPGIPGGSTLIFEIELLGIA